MLKTSKTIYILIDTDDAGREAWDCIQSAWYEKSDALEEMSRLYKEEEIKTTIEKMEVF
ncbi:MAG: hypothetical protein ACTSP4_00755 [Candidatus Hodarchaeales archaeon]